MSSVAQGPGQMARVTTLPAVPEGTRGSEIVSYVIPSMTLSHHKRPGIVTEVTSGCGDDFYFLSRLSSYPTYYFYHQNQKVY